MKQNLKNGKMEEMLHQLSPILSYKNVLGYVAARNYRIISDCLTEYTTFKGEIVKKYGEQERDENGNLLPFFSISVSSPNFKMFCDELAPIANKEHEVNIMMAKYTDAVGMLSGEEILSIDWMLED